MDKQLLVDYTVFEVTPQAINESKGSSAIDKYAKVNKIITDIITEF